MPTFMGGNFDGKTAFVNTMTNNPFGEFPSGIYNWFLYSSGMYFGELIRQVFIDEHKSDFGEILAHHLATIFLTFGSAYANLVGIGATISWLHIVTDIPISAGRISTTQKSSFAEILGGVILVCGILPSWIYLRVGCFLFWIINIFTNPACAYPSHLEHLDIFLQLNGLYLCVLQLLHIYWIILMFNILIGFLRGSGLHDL